VQPQGPLDALQPQLRELETRLSSALYAVCGLPPPEKLNTGELIRVEETLALATEAAKEAVSLGLGRSRTCPKSVQNDEGPSDKSPLTILQVVAAQRTGWDSNPRYAINVHKLSRRSR